MGISPPLPAQRGGLYLWRGAVSAGEGTTLAGSRTPLSPMGAGFSREEGHEDHLVAKAQGRAESRLALMEVVVEEEEGEEKREAVVAAIAVPRGPAFPPTADPRGLRLLLLRLGSSRRRSLPLM